LGARPARDLGTGIGWLLGVDGASRATKRAVASEEGDSEYALSPVGEQPRIERSVATLERTAKDRPTQDTPHRASAARESERKLAMHRCRQVQPARRGDGGAPRLGALDAGECRDAEHDRDHDAVARGEHDPRLYAGQQATSFARLVA